MDMPEFLFKNWDICLKSFKGFRDRFIFLKQNGEYYTLAKQRFYSKYLNDVSKCEDLNFKIISLQLFVRFIGVRS